MISHNELALRLNKRLYNDTRVNEEEDKLKASEELTVENHSNNSDIQSNVSITKHSLLDYAKTIVNIIAFGYATQLVLNANWPIIGTLAVGYSINFIIKKTLKNL